MARESAFAEPFMLKSEHKMILAHAHEIADNRARAERKRGFWQGIAHTIWITGFVALFAALVGFNIGIGVFQ